MTKEILLELRTMQKQGIGLKQIAEALSLKYYTANVYISGRFRNKKPGNIRVKKEKKEKEVLYKHWTYSDKKTLKDGFEKLPNKYSTSLEFYALCGTLNRSVSSVIRMIGELGLKKTERTSPVVPDKVVKLNRPPTVYTNTKSPYGIGSELNAGNRIYV